MKFQTLFWTGVPALWCARAVVTAREKRAAKGMMLRLAPIFALLATLAIAAASAQAESPRTEYELKAAYICRFLPFLEWPATAFENDQAPLIVGVAGENPFGGELESMLKDKAVGSHPVIFKHFDSLASVSRCHLLFVAAGETHRLPEAAARLERGHTLLVGDAGNFIHAGGAIRFYRDENRIRFEINTTAVDRAGIKASSKLLKLAKVVEE